jgi:beta-galactosidase/beta-glucuronidase
VQNVRVNPVQADIDVTVFPQELLTSTQVRGRIVGPSCEYASTVEVAYPFREYSRDLQTPAKVILRAIIPEPCLWDQESPFLYRVVLELWQDGQQCDQKSLMHAIRK